VLSVIGSFLFLLAQDPEKIRAEMAASIERQQTSVRAQAQSTGVWAGTGWAEMSLRPIQPPDCDPVPKPELSKIIDEAAKKEGVDPALVTEVARKESGFRPCAISPKGAEGLMQLMPETQSSLSVLNPFDAQASVEGGTKLLKQLLDRFHGDLALTLAAYNAGAGRVEKIDGVPDIPETKNYVLDILSRLPFVPH